MSSRLEDLSELARLLDDGKITQREFEVVKNELLEASVDDWTNTLEVEALIVNGEDAEREAVPVGIPVDSGEPRDDDTAADPDWLVFAKEIPHLYWASLGAALFTVFLGGTFAPIAWIAVVVSAMALVRVKDEGMRWMAWTGLALGLFFALFALFTSGTEEVEASPLAPTSSSSETVTAVPEGSLGIEFSELKEGWNAVPDPPLIVSGVTAAPEVGPLDSFLYRFDDAAVLAGAYNPADGYIYALMAKVGIRHEALPNMFVHVCYVLYPGTQDCFEEFMDESGVYGKTPEELSDGEFSTSWTFQTNEWRVEVVDDIETIRVLGPVQAD